MQVLHEKFLFGRWGAKASKSKLTSVSLDALSSPNGTSHGEICNWVETHLEYNMPLNF